MSKKFVMDLRLKNFFATEIIFELIFKKILVLSAILLCFAKLSDHKRFPIPELRGFAGIPLLDGTDVADNA